MLPLDLLRKQNLVNFAISDQTGQSLPYLTRIQTGVLTGVMLTKYAEGLLDEPLPYDIATFLQDLAARDADDIHMEENWESITFLDPRVQIVKNRLTEMVEFTSVFKRLTNNFILLVPIDGSPGTRLKMRYCLDVPIDVSLKEPPNEGALQRFGWCCTRIDFPLEAATETEIYHFEVEDPPGIDLHMAAICEQPAPLNGRLFNPIIHDWQPGGRPRLNLVARGVQRGSIVRARVDIRSSRQGWLPAFTICSWALALLLAIGSWRLPYMLTLGKQTEGTDPVGVAAALLLFLTTAMIATLLVRPDEHGLVRKILLLLRGVAMVTAALPVVAVTALLFIPPNNPALRWTWFGLAAVALLVAMVSTLSYLLPRRAKPIDPKRGCA